jgi:hypothetical protein
VHHVGVGELRLQLAGKDRHLRREDDARTGGAAE